MTFQVNYITTLLSNDKSKTISNVFNSSVLSYELESWSKFVDKNNTYVECPVWNHKAKRTFIVRSPIDFSMKYDRNTGRVDWKYDIDIDFDYFYFEPGFDVNNPIVQAMFPSVMMWTKQRNIWVEARPHAYTSANNNLVAIGGWWNLSRWVRPINFAFQFVDEDAPVVVKRGDILYEICLYNQHNLNDNVKLIREESLPHEIANQAANNVDIKKIVRKLSPDNLFQSQPKSRCPFAFLKR